MNNDSIVTVLLADDHTMVRDSLARVLDTQSDIQVVGQASDGTELISLAEKLQPDCVVMDYSMPNHKPLEVLKWFAKKASPPKTIVLTVHENVHYAVRVIEAGANGYVIKAAAVDELLTAIKSVCSGNIYLSKEIAEAVWKQLRNPKSNRTGLSNLSQREMEVLRLIGQGKTLQESAKAIGVKVSTISTYRSRILEKLNLESTNDLVRFVIANGLDV
jgi:DNA-binding NarL/FixJ family response regulator